MKLTDWKLLQELVTAFSEAALLGSEDRDATRNELVAWLGELDRKYGPQALVLATRALFVANRDEQESLLYRAYVAAKTARDRQSSRALAHLIAVLLDSRDSVPITMKT